MSKIGVFYGSSTGYTADVANRIAKALGVEMADVYDVANAAPSMLGDYDAIVMGCSTWGDGDLQDDFADFLDGAEALYLKGKKIAIFGCGDESYSDTFCASVGTIYDRMQKTEADFIGAFNADGYDFSNSPAEKDGKYVGLLIDEVNHADLSDARIAEWTAELKQEL